jgi:Dolichyl-phosphate-mannose-protein mannosyltransferase
VIAKGPPVCTRWATVGALLALAALARVLAMFYGSLSGDDATVALMAKHVLSGENFPVFFYRQTYMGSLNGIHLVPALYVFGPSVLLVRLNAIAWSLLFPLGLYHLGRRIFDEATGRATLALAAVPPFLLMYWSTVAEPHFETNVLGVWLLLLALGALTARSEPARARALAVFGLLGGLALWTSVKVSQVLVPAIVLLVLRGPRRLLGRGGALMAGGLLLGSMPAWLFYFVHGDRATGIGSVGHILDVTIDLSAERLGEFWTEVVQRLLGTYYWEPNTPLRRAGLALNCVVYALGLAFALIQLVRWRRGTQPSRRAWGLGLLLLTLLASFGTVYFSGLADELNHETSRYALPAYIPLLVYTGALIAWARQRSRATGTVLLAFLLLFAGWTDAGFLWPLVPELRARESARIRTRQDVRNALAARPAEALYIEDTLSAIAWAFLLDRPPVSAVNADVYVPNAVAADAAQRIDILAPNHADDVAASLQALGATSRQTSFVGRALFEDVRVPARSYRLVPRSAWRVAGDARVPASIADGDLATSWPPPGPDRPLDAFVLDLGRSYDVARLVFWPSVSTVDLFPLQLSGSVDGIRWDTVGTVPVIAREPMFVASGRPVFRPRNGWLDLIVTPRPLRYVRVEPTDPPGDTAWGVTELQVYELGATPPDRVDVNQLVGRLRSYGIQRLLADPVASARVHLAMRGAISTLLANGVVDNHGAAPPAWLARPIRLRPDDALLVPIEDLPELRERLEHTGTRFRAEAVGDQVLIRVLEPLASTAPCEPASARSVSRESVVGGRVLHTTLEADLREERLVSGVRLWHPTKPGPIAVRVAASRDGQDWQPVEGGRLVPAWGWAGRTLFTAWDPFLEVVLGPTPVRRIRVTVSSDDPNLKILCVRELGTSSNTVRRRRDPESSNPSTKPGQLHSSSTRMSAGRAQFLGVPTTAESGEPRI